MATLEYRFTRSTPVLRDLARTRRQSPPSPLLRTSSGHAEKVKTLEFIDSSLSLLGDLQRDQDDLQKAQDNHIRREFEQQREFIRDKFAQEQYENGRRDSTVDQRFTKIKEQLESFRKEIDKRFEEVGQRFEEVGQRFEEVGQRFEEVGQRFEEVGQRFDEAESKFDDFSNQVDQRFDQVDQQFSEINARMFNALSYRDRHPIQPLAVLRGGRLREPDKDCFPGTVKEFLAMRSAPNTWKIFSLFQFYSIEEYKLWDRDSEASKSDSKDPPVKGLTLDDAVRCYPSQCLEALARRLGLDYDKICTSMKLLEESRQQVTAKPSKRRHAEIISSKDSEISKRSHRSPSESTNSEPQLEEDDNHRSLQVRNSQGETDVVSETDLLGTQPPSQGSTEVFSFERTQPTN